MSGLQIGLLTVAVLLALSGAVRLLGDGSSVAGWMMFAGGALWAVITIAVWVRSRRTG